MWHIYLIKNLVNNKLYVGKAANVRQRWNVHKSKARQVNFKYPLHHAISKYGIENFSITILYSYELEADSLERERQLISQFKIDGYCLYNITDGGEGTSGWKASDATKKKMSVAASGKEFTEEHRRNLSLSKQNFVPWNKGKPHTEVTKKKIGLANKGRSFSLGRKHSEETKLKISLSSIGKKHSEESKLKMSFKGEANKQSKLTWNKVDEIRELFSKGRSYQELGTQFNVHEKTIGKICRNKSWIKPLTMFP